MTTNLFRLKSTMLAAAFLLCMAMPAVAQYQLITLVANERDLGHNIPAARYLDARVVNAWGLAYQPNGPLWITDEYTGLSTAYGPDGHSAGIQVTIPTSPDDPLPPGCPTGIVANRWGGFMISENGNSGSALFLFATLDGTISGWNPSVDPNNAVVVVNNWFLPAAYTAMDITHDASGTFIYLVDALLNQIEKYDSNFNLVTTFKDPNIPFAAYGLAAIQGKIYVSFAPIPPGKPGFGAVDIFDENGNLLKTLIPPNQVGGPLNVPYAMAMAPANFGAFSNTLLVGNLQDGRINAFDPNSGAFLGALSDAHGRAIEVPGLWDFDFGGGTSNNGRTDELFFVAGPEYYFGGVFGKIVLAGNVGTNGSR